MKNWEKQFDEEFKDCPKDAWFGDVEPEIKQFIKDLLEKQLDSFIADCGCKAMVQQERKEIIEWAEKERIAYLAGHFTEEQRKAIQAIVDDLITHLKSKE